MLGDPDKGIRDAVAAHLLHLVDGDLDRPIVTGRVYNNISNPLPYDLPQQAAYSGFKTATLKGGHDDYNELRFDDTQKQEEIKLRAQRNLTTQVLHDSATTIGHDHHHTVKNDMNVAVSEGKYIAKVARGTMLHHVPSDRYDVNAKQIVHTADDSITFQVKGVSITIDDKSITLNVNGSTEIKLELAMLSMIAPKIDLNPMGGMPGTPPNIASLADSTSDEPKS